MYKIRRIKFKNHPLLNDLELDFCAQDGNAVDTVLIAGENGNGKSTVLTNIYNIVSGKIDFDLEMILETPSGTRTLAFTTSLTPDGYTQVKVTDDDKLNTSLNVVGHPYQKKYPLRGIYTDVGINFNSQDITNVTSMNIDASNESRRSNTDLPKQINQLLIDIQALDDAELAHAYRNAKESKQPIDDIKYQERIPRFTGAFNKMFDTLTYNRVTNSSNGKSKKIIFRKNGIDIPIEGLSSGEKQIVYRGCFLLRDIEAINGAFVFIDEPEISLHPIWQMKIMDYYKGIFTNNDGVQTSQIFAVTHSPFIIHNENRKNDKVIVLARDENGDVIVKDKPEYFKCNSLEAVQDAFSISDFTAEKPIVYLEGRTDEKYFKKAVEVFGYNELPFDFKWIGYIDEKGQEANTGKDALNKAVSFLTSRCLATKNVCLYDCDTNKPQKEENNVITISIPKFDNDRKISIGIENALVFGDLDIDEYRKQRVEFDGYGIEKRIPDFRKMECCDYICSLDTKRLKQVFINLKAEIDTLIKLFGDK